MYRLSSRTLFCDLDNSGRAPPDTLPSIRHVVRRGVALSMCEVTRLLGTRPALSGSQSGFCRSLREPTPTHLHGAIVAYGLYSCSAPCGE
eukprot:3079975-Prymnesium_polylepis.1